MMLKLLRQFALVFVAGLVVTNGAAHASTIDLFEVVAGGAQISGGGLATSSSSGIIVTGFGMAQGGIIGTPLSISPISLSLDASGSTIGSGNLFALLPLPPGPLPYLSGALLDAKAESGLLTFLFSIVGGAGAPAFGSHVFVTLSNPTFNSGTFGQLQNIPAPTTLSAQVGIDVKQVTPVPLPAGAFLLLSGLLVLTRLGRKRFTA